MNNPLVSVIIATYKRTKSLNNALNSLISQSYKNFEVIVVDDNADVAWSKEIEDIVNEFSKNNPTISLLYVKNDVNSGSAKTRNNGIKAAKGEYITFLDDDDLYLENKIEIQLKAMIENEADFSITDLDLFNSQEKKVDSRVRSYIKQTDSDSLLKYHLLYHLTGTDTLMFKKSYLTKIGMFPLVDVGDEFYLMKEAICGQGKFLYVPGCQVKAYVHVEEEGLSSGQGKIDGENILYEYKKTMFSLLDKKSIRYINMRHYAVLAFAELRRSKYFKFLYLGVKSFLIYPSKSLDLLLNRKS